MDKLFFQFGEIAIFFKDIILNLFHKQVKYRYIKEALYDIGVGTLPIIGVMAIFTGMVIAVNTYYQFKVVNLENFTGSVVGLSMAIELGPVLTAIIVSARVGTSN
jgi:phospholipid/cholesterol/gamma-HCH transport system permease protein